MKTLSSSIAALLAFRNEEIFMETYMLHMSKFADIILGFDDDSSDNSRDIFLRNGGILVPKLFGRDSGQGATLDIREQLLLEGRKKGYSKFIVLDCDEVIIAKKPEVLKSKIAELGDGSKLLMKWIMSDQSGKRYLNEQSVWSPKDKDFAFSDCPNMEYPKDRKFVHFSRTPSCRVSDPHHVIVDSEDSFVLHLQFLNWELGQIKQCWYRLREVLHLGRSFTTVNETYKFTKEKPDESLSTPFACGTMVDFSESEARSFPVAESWYFRDIKVMLQRTRKFRVRNIDIWHLDIMQELYFDTYGTGHSFSYIASYLERWYLRGVHFVYLIKIATSRRKKVIKRNG